MLTVGSAKKSDGEHYADRAYCLPSEEVVARVLAEAMRQKPLPDNFWHGQVESFRDLEAKFPDYAEGYSLATDAFRQARAVLALFAPILAEKAERDAYEATLAETGKWLQELAENPPEPNEALKKLVADYKATGIKSVGLDSPHNACCYRDECKALEARALAAEAALAAERKQVGQLALLLDKQMGTPCEQIRHQQEIENLETSLAAARANAVDGSIDIRLDDKGGIDEIFGNGVLCHIERMNRGGWFISLTRPDQSQEAFWLTGKGKVEFTLQEHRNAPTTGPNVEPWTIAAAIRAQGQP